MLARKRTSVTDFNFHLVLVTKYRKEIFTTREKHDNMIAILKKIAENKEVTISHIEVMPDHVHLMISFPPKLAPSDVVKSLKGTSAREWFKQFPETKKLLWGGHLWTGSFFMSTVGNISKEIVAEYIENQMQKDIKKDR
ncbi:IS200/IS605 family transposase [Streptococcus hyointestinalis]|uniref:IS200/IS605 family transposase n=1 Tax=Streptococcus hyointestinalis TaxID=1337 RepID=UPI003F94FFD0